MNGYACNACGKPAKLRCPKCMSFDIVEGSHFCSQDCFKGSWGTHKSIHPAAKPKTFDPWPKWGQHTGKIRPVYPLSAKREVPRHIGRPDYADLVDGASAEERREKNDHKILVLSKEEQEHMRVSCRLAREVIEEGAKLIKPGTTLDEIDRVVHDATVERNSYPSPLNYHTFPKSCCTSVNEVICHGIPDQYELQDGDICNLDVSLFHNGFHSDLNETYLVGNVDEKGRKLVDVTRECLWKAIDMVKPGVLYRDLGAVIQQHAESNGFSVVRQYCGHGINRLFHPSPSIPHYRKNKAVGVMKAGHAFTIEPMINEGVYEGVHWPDNWTCVTKDGKRSAQFEETLLVTETGVEVLTAKPGTVRGILV
ncbi:Methionine aminopeptidase 1 [Rhizophlyctis rosea]|nr:Methionine aminopeptidase 1 [Rhizophlyctis rosea]